MLEPCRMLSVAAVLAACCPGQVTGRIVPPWAAAGDLVESSYAPFQSDVARTQQIWDPGVVATAPSVLTSVAFRRDATLIDPYAARTVTSVVGLCHSLKTASTMSQTFADNRSTSPTLVFAGTYQLPAQPPVSGVGPWNVMLPFNAPFIYDPLSGSLLLEWRSVPTLPRAEYALDAHRDSGFGLFQSFGFTGSFAAGDVVHYTAIGDLRPGGSLGGDARFLTQPYPSFAFLGLSNAFWQGLQLPIDLAQVGAPGNSLYVSPDVAVPMQVSAVSQRYAARFSLRLPANPWLAGRTVYTQACLLDPFSNALGAVFSNAVAVSFGTGPGFTRVLLSFDASQPRGVFLFGNDPGGPVVRFEGLLH